MVHVDVSALNLVVAVLIPLAVGLVTKSSASSAVKAVVHLLLAAVAGGVLAAIDNEGVFTTQTAYDALFVWGTGVVSYFGFTKPTTVAAKVANVAPEVGVG